MLPCNVGSDLQAQLYVFMWHTLVLQSTERVTASRCMHINQLSNQLSRCLAGHY